ncbi:MAG: ATP-binding cassette domain-containing protein, partial [Actinomycetales bacterium]
QPKERDIAMVFQNYALYPHMTVRDNMAFSLMLAKVDKSAIAERVKRAADILGLGELLERYPRQLSGGQRQRVAMGRAIVRNPQVFLFDEPLSNLDAKLRVQMRAEIKELHQRLKTTSVYVTHDQIEAMTMADQIVVMRDGRVEQRGRPLDLYDNPANLFVAGFIGSPPMNFLPATVEDGKITLPFGTFPLPADKAARAEGKGLMLAGIRPEHFEDVSVLKDEADSSRTFEAHIDVREWLGDQQYAYVPYDADATTQDQLRELAREADSESLRTQLVVSLDAASKITDDDNTVLFIDTDKLHLFDPTSGENLTVGL